MAQRQRGELEAELMDVLWDNPEGLTSTEIRSRFDEPIPVATTVVTVLERMREKGMVVREKNDGRGYRYTASTPREESLAGAMARSLSDATNRELLLLNFAGNLTESDRALLRAALTDK
jgi:predicted transcriptional regulator